jgi:hypothetical protein
MSFQTNLKAVLKYDVKLLDLFKGVWLNGTAADSKSANWRFESFHARQMQWIGTVDVQGSSKPL